MLISENEILQLLSQKLKSKRLEHSVNVAKRAEYLAELYQYDKRIAKMTGLLHDVCKNDNFDIMLQTIANSGIILLLSNGKVRRCIMQLPVLRLLKTF